MCPTLEVECSPVSPLFLSAPLSRPPRLKNIEKHRFLFKKKSFVWPPTPINGSTALWQKFWFYWTPFTPVNRLKSLQLNEIGKKGKLGKKQKMTCKLKAKGNAKTFPLSPADQKFLTGLKLVRILRPRYADLPRNSIFELVQKNSFQTWTLCSTPQNKITDSLWIQWKVVETKPA